MPGRVPKPLFRLPEVWDKRTANAVYEYLRSLWGGMAGLQGVPEDPSTISAGAVVDAGASQAPAASDHTHPVSTGAPSQSVALGGASSEGGATSLLRSDATLVLSQGGAVDGDALVWNGSAWSPTEVPSVLGIRSFSPRHQAIPEIRAGSGVTLTRDASGVTIDASGSTDILAVQSFIGRPRPDKEIRAGSNVTISSDAAGYTISASGGSGSPDDADMLIANRCFGG